MGPADSNELSRMVMPTEPSAPVLSTSAVSSRMPTRAGSVSPSARRDLALGDLDLADVGMRRKREPERSRDDRQGRGRAGAENVFAMRSPPSPIFLGMKFGELNLRETGGDGPG